MKIDHKKEKGEPAGGWLGPSTHDWPDLPERDLPSFMREPGARPPCPRPPEDQRWKPETVGFRPSAFEGLPPLEPHTLATIAVKWRDHPERQGAMRWINQWAAMRGGL